jgi:hypothetical protein
VIYIYGGEGGIRSARFCSLSRLGGKMLPKVAFSFSARSNPPILVLFYMQNHFCNLFAYMAERAGFEPAWDCSQTDFEG